MKRWHVLTGVGLISFLVMLIALVYAPTLEPVQSFRSDSYSRGALGYHAFLRTLEGMGHSIRTSRYMSEPSAGAAHVLMVLAPHESKTEPGLHSGFLTKAGLKNRKGRTLLVLPKYRAKKSHADHPQWAGKIHRLPLKQVGYYLESLADPPRIARGASASECHWSDGRPARLALSDVQFMEPSSSISPILSCGAQIIAGRGMTEKGGAVLVIAEPDLISNWSLGKKDNAQVAYELTSGFAGHSEMVVDETCHGYLVPPSIWRMLLEFPMVILTMHGLLFSLIAVWIAAIRFGAPDPPGNEWAPGASYLIANSASLLAFGGYSESALEQYVDCTIRDVTRRLRLSNGGSRTEVVATLDQIGIQRGLSRSLSELIAKLPKTGSRSRTVAAHKRIRLARRIHAWKKEILAHA